MTAAHPAETRLLNQAELPLFRPVRPFTPLTFRFLLSILSDGRWHTARELKVYGFSERELRLLVEDSEGLIFSFPGSPDGDLNTIE